MREMISRRTINLLGAAASLICLAYFAHTAAGYVDSLRSVASEAWRRLPIGLALYAVAYLASAAGWVLILRATGSPTALRTGIGIFWAAQFGKYLPGNVGHHVGRVVLARRFGLNTTQVMKSMALELGLVVGLIALFALPSIGRLAGRSNPTWSVAGFAALAAVGLIALFGHRARTRATPAPSPTRMSGAGFAAAVALLAIGILLSGGSLAPLAPGIAPDPATLVYLVSLFCVAWLGGFVVPGAPAGLGVRELILVEGLSPLVGPADAVTAALLFRVLTVAADLMAFAAGLLLLKHADAQSAPGAPDGGRTVPQVY